MAKKREEDRTYAVIGLGTFGRKICEELSSRGALVIAMDRNNEQIEKIKNHVTQAITIDATDEDSYSEITWDEIDLAIVAIGENVESNILATALLKQKGIPYVISRAISPLHKKVLEQIGADEIINIEEDEGARIAQRLLAPQILGKTPLSKEISIAEVFCPDSLAGKLIKHTDLRAKMELNIVAIKRTDLTVSEEGNTLSQVQLLFPSPDLEIQEEDILIIMGKNLDIQKLAQS